MLYKIGLDLDGVLENIRIELPQHIYFETCGSSVTNEDKTMYGDGEAVIMNYLAEGISILGTISGFKGEEVVVEDFDLQPKSNISFGGWDYSNNHKVELSFSARLLNGQKIRLVDEIKIPLTSRFKQFVFYS